MTTVPNVLVRSIVRLGITVRSDKIYMHPEHDGPAILKRFGLMYAYANRVLMLHSGGGGISPVQALQKQRAAVTNENSIGERSLVPNDRAFDSTVKIIRSGARRITSAEVITETGETIPYEHLVIATGSVWTGPLALPELRENAIEHFRSFKKQLDVAEHILIVGGGSVCLEYAGEIQHYYPGKKITIIHGVTELMNSTYPHKFRKSLLDALTKKGAHVVLGDKISPDVLPEDGYVTTQSGTRIRADLVIPAAGGRPNTAVVSTLDSSVVTKSGTVLVTPELRVKLSSGAQNVWAIGDIIEWPEQKVGALDPGRCTGHAPTVAKNILASVQGGKEAQYEGKPEMIFVTLGPKGGRGLAPFFGGVVIGDWIVSKMKSSGLFVDKIRGILGATTFKPLSLWRDKILKISISRVAEPVLSGADAYTRGIVALPRHHCCCQGKRTKPELLRRHWAHPPPDWLKRAVTIIIIVHVVACTFGAVPGSRPVGISPSPPQSAKLKKGRMGIKMRGDTELEVGFLVGGNIDTSFAYNGFINSTVRYSLL
ncbi:pyridine nucleotide-disulfide oxidoreductase domain-containing protein [Rhizoctonia solani AG-1 IA]|uniref:Pyridine nucleotide-disulfide oxidoreductase domain-containing protein n=1 Tax=Thanatephorus cucumeris (strain AG1-IA) TaxID=983506 RepID=L8WZ03_THACA|nr:pyridine nucleotide-disulfide oxidoreductase domain-containing protein [Rhizoctonia solani AG-1 IA]